MKVTADAQELLIQANYYGSLANSSWLTHVATCTVTEDTPHQEPECSVLFSPGSCEKSRTLRRATATALLIAWLHGSVAADPKAPEVPAPDPAATPTARTPWVDLGRSPIVETAVATT